MPFRNAALSASGANTLIVAPAFDRSALPADHRSGRGREAMTKAVGDGAAANVPTNYRLPLRAMSQSVNATMTIRSATVRSMPQVRPNNGHSGRSESCQ
jgi:hypothetical protein